MHRDDGAFVPRGDTVVFVSTSRGIGGPARSLLTVLDRLGDDLGRVLFAPPGDLASLARSHGVAHHLPMPFDLRHRRRSRIRAATILARYVRHHRRHIVAVHANGQSELNLAAAVMVIARVPIVMWAHTSKASPTAAILGPCGVVQARRSTGWRCPRRLRRHSSGPSGSPLAPSRSSRIRSTLPSRPTPCPTRASGSATSVWRRCPRASTCSPPSCDSSIGTTSASISTSPSRPRTPRCRSAIRGRSSTSSARSATSPCRDVSATWLERTRAATSSCAPPGPSRSDASLLKP